MYNPPVKHGKKMEAIRLRDGLRFRGEIIVELHDKNGKLLSRTEDKNFIVDLGHEIVIDVLTGVASRKMFRMAIGDDGTLTGQPFVPKTPDATWPALTGLFHEVIRRNIDTTTQPTTKTMRFLCAFQSTTIDDTSFSSSPKVINEAMLIMSNGTQTGEQQINKAAPDSVDADETMFSIRTFKSQPFDPADTLTLTIAWTIFVQ